MPGGVKHAKTVPSAQFCCECKTHFKNKEYMFEKIKWFISEWITRWILTALEKEYHQSFVIEEEYQICILCTRSMVSTSKSMHSISNSPKIFQDNLDFKHLALLTPGNYWADPMCRTEYITIYQTMCLNFLFGKYGQNRFSLPLLTMGLMRMAFQNASDRTWLEGINFKSSCF